MKFVKTWCVFIWMLLFLSFTADLRAHAINDMILEFTNSEHQSTLTVHTTPETAYDILKSMQPNLPGIGLDFADFRSDFADYFNEHLVIQFAGRVRTLYIEELNLNKHDAYLKFRLSGPNLDWCSYRIAVTALEFYRSPTFTIVLPSGNELVTHQLDKTTPLIAVRSSSGQRVDACEQSVFWVFVLSCFAGVVYLLGARLPRIHSALSYFGRS